MRLNENWVAFLNKIYEVILKRGNMKNKKTLCLVMIVRNESKVIKRCLDRIKNYIDYWVIVDTGSDDNTKEIIQKELMDIPGELHQQEWVNFGVNRTQSLALAKNKADYLLLCDADEQIIFSSDFDSNMLIADAYLISHIGSNDYAVPYLIRGDLNWKYIGVTHEYLSSDIKTKREKITTINILDLQDGGFKDDKFERDIALLTKGLIEEPENDRYKFYLANSYRDIRDYQNAAKWYEKRIQDKGWREEVGCSYYNLGICYEKLGKLEKALNTWLMGYDYDPSRMESLYRAVRLLRIQEKYKLGYQLGLIAKNIPYPKNDILFIQSRVYHFWIYYELSICAYYVNDFQLGYDCCKQVLFNEPTPNILEVTINNLRFYKEHALTDTSQNVKKLIEIIQNYLKDNDNKYAENILDYFKNL